MPTKIGLIKLLSEIITEVGDLENIKPYTDIKYHSPSAASFSTESGESTESGDQVDMEIETGIEWFELKLGLVEIPKIVQQTYDQIKDNTDKTDNTDIVSVNFLVNHDAAQGKKSHIKEYYRILKTVLEFTNDYVTKFNPFIVLIIAEEASSDKNIKNQFYSNIINKNISSNYRIVDNIEMKDKHKGYMLMRNIKEK
jgi:hypothetical protein